MLNAIISQDINISICSLFFGKYVVIRYNNNLLTVPDLQYWKTQRATCISINWGSHLCNIWQGLGPIQWKTHYNLFQKIPFAYLNTQVVITCTERLIFWCVTVVSLTKISHPLMTMKIVYQSLLSDEQNQLNITNKLLSYDN